MPSALLKLFLFISYIVFSVKNICSQIGMIAVQNLPNGDLDSIRMLSQSLIEPY